MGTPRHLFSLVILYDLSKLSVSFLIKKKKKNGRGWEFPGGLGVRTLCFYHCSLGSHQAAAHPSQKKKKKEVDTNLATLQMSREGSQETMSTVKMEQ